MKKFMNGFAEKLKHTEEEVEEKTTKECPFCKSEIAITATRCPHCTSKPDGIRILGFNLLTGKRPLSP